MPPIKKITKDFLKEVFADRKHLIPRPQLRPVEVPKYDELSVVSLITDVMAQPELAKFFPQQRTVADLPEREFFFNVVNTADPQYVSALIKHAHSLRFGDKDPNSNKNIIEVTQEWVKELEASPYYSRNTYLYNLSIGHHGKTLMLLKKESKPSNAGFKRKKLDVLGSYA
jgi:hypothetical protein